MKAEKEGKMVKKISLFCVAVALCVFLAQPVFAASSDTVTISVTVSSTLGVDITEGTLSLGSVGVGTTTTSPTGVTITNTGSGANETYELSLTNPTGWTASQTAAGVDTYMLCAAFDTVGTSISWSAANDALSTTPVACSATKFAGNATGLSVPYNIARKLWFQFKAPTQSSITTLQAITLTVTAVAG